MLHVKCLPRTGCHGRLLEVVHQTQRFDAALSAQPRPASAALSAQPRPPSTALSAQHRPASAVPSSATLAAASLAIPRQQPLPSGAPPFALPVHVAPPTNFGSRSDVAK